MYQETNGGNATKKQDLLLFFGLQEQRRAGIRKSQSGFRGVEPGI